MRVPEIAVRGCGFWPSDRLFAALWIKPFDCPVQGLGCRMRIPLTPRGARMAHEPHHCEDVRAILAKRRKYI